MALEVRQIVSGQWSCHCYVVSDASRAAIIIDPGEGFQAIMNYVADAGLEVKSILLTHGHFDHTGAAAQLKEALDVPLFMHRADMKILKHANLYRQSFAGAPPIKIQNPDGYLVEGLLPIAPFSVEVIETPGHTQGSVCLQIENYLFTGDTLLHGRIGRTDLPGGNRGTLVGSLRRLSGVPLDTIVCPGHGSLTSFADELQNNAEFKEVLHGN